MPLTMPPTSFAAGFRLKPSVVAPVLALLPASNVAANAVSVNVSVAMVRVVGVAGDGILAVGEIAGAVVVRAGVCVVVVGAAVGSTVGAAVGAAVIDALGVAGVAFDVVVATVAGVVVVAIVTGVGVVVVTVVSVVVLVGAVTVVAAVIWTVVGREVALAHVHPISPHVPGIHASSPPTRVQAPLRLTHVVLPVSVHLQ